MSCIFVLFKGLLDLRHQTGRQTKGARQKSEAVSPLTDIYMLFWAKPNNNGFTLRQTGLV